MNQPFGLLHYGAPAKGTVLLNYCGIGTDLLPVVLDLTPADLGPCELSRINPDALLLLARNHAPEIFEREHFFRTRGGQFLIESGGESHARQHELPTTR